MKTMVRLVPLVLWATFSAVTSAQATCDQPHGATLFESKCKVCHNLGQDTKHTAGPSLTGVFGRKVASVAGFRYSPVLLKAGGEWTAERLDTWLANPPKLYPGTAMAFRGLKSADDRADIVCFLEGGGKERSNAATRREASGALIDTTNASPVRAEISNRLRRIEAFWQAGDATAMVESLYANDAIIAGEGQAKVARGKAEIGTLLDSLIKENKMVHIDLNAVVDLGKDATATWVT